MNIKKILTASLIGAGAFILIKKANKEIPPATITSAGLLEPNDKKILIGQNQISQFVNYKYGSIFKIYDTVYLYSIIDPSAQILLPDNAIPNSEINIIPSPGELVKINRFINGTKLSKRTNIFAIYKSNSLPLN